MNRNAAATSVRPADPCCFVIFGASGDLTHRLLIPALYNLAVSSLLPDPISIIGVGRTAVSSEDFRKDLKKSLHAFATRRLDDAIAKRLLDCITYVPTDSDDPQAYEMLSREIDRVERVRPSPVLSRDAAGGVRADRAQPRAVRTCARRRRRMAARHHREAVRHRSRVRTRAQ
jgi:hypothetical protein